MKRFLEFILTFLIRGLKRHAKRRLTYHTYLALYKQILKEDGEIHFKTDNRGLFAFSLESMSQFGMYFTKMNLNLHDEDDEDNILTEYEKKFSEKGSRIYRMEAKFHKTFNVLGVGQKYNLAKLFSLSLSQLSLFVEFLKRNSLCWGPADKDG